MICDESLDGLQSDFFFIQSVWVSWFHQEVPISLGQKFIMSIDINMSSCIIGARKNREITDICRVRKSESRGNNKYIDFMSKRMSHLWVRRLSHHPLNPSSNIAIFSQRYLHENVSIPGKPLIYNINAALIIINTSNIPLNITIATNVQTIKFSTIMTRCLRRIQFFVAAHPTWDLVVFRHVLSTHSSSTQSQYAVLSPDSNPVSAPLSQLITSFNSN